MHWQLSNKIHSKLIDETTYIQVYNELSPEIFHDQPIFEPLEKSMKQEPQIQALLNNIKDAYKLYIGIYDGEKLIGFHWGFQDGLSYYMARTGLLPAYQNQGLYQAFLANLIDHLKGVGFTALYSKHIMTHNQIIVPKLKAGFVINKFELSEYFGVLVNLSYFFDEKRKEMLNYRAGKRTLDTPVERDLKLAGT